MKYSTILKQLFVISKTNWLKSFIKGHKFSLSSYEILTNLKGMAPNHDLIIDIGANSGQFTKVSNYFYPTAKIYTFEPLKDLFEGIEKSFKNIKNINPHNIAFGNEDGHITFYKNAYGHISSALEISEENKHYPKESITKIKVPITKVDVFFKDIDIPKQTLLKLDVQGFELEVLKGAIDTLKAINYVIIEANLEKLYDNQPSFSTVHSFLLENGFDLNGMLDFNLGNKNKYIEIDLLYKKV
jgi:FkbM family methyltransferase